MSILQQAWDVATTVGLSTAFMFAVDMAFASMTGMIGLHGWIVDAGTSLGKDWGIPQVDWANLWNNWDLSFIDPETDPCLSAGGHHHGSVCDYSAHTPPPTAPAPQRF